jgi:hypothetical protein
MATAVNWRAVRAAAGLALTFDVVLALFGVRAAADHPNLPAKLTGPATPKRAVAMPAPPRPIIAVPPAPVRLKRRDIRSDEELGRQLFAAPELDLDADPATGSRFLAATPRSDFRFTEPLLDTLLKRPDLQGLPLAMGNDCRLYSDPAKDLERQSRALRRQLSECLLAEAPNAALLRPHLLQAAGNQWRRDEDVPVLVQMLQAEDQPVRLLLVELLARIPGRRASAALAGRAVFDLSAEVREAAVQALADRPRDQFRCLLLDGLRYPWAPAADHAAEALVALDDRESLPRLTALLDEPDPASPVARTFHDLDPALIQSRPWHGTRPIAVLLDEGQAGQRRTAVLPCLDGVAGPSPALTGSASVVREVVRVNHLRNCLLCHAASSGRSDPLHALVPSSGQPLPPPFSSRYYNGDGSRSTFVRADVTYLRQDFSVPQPVANPGNWPEYQRYDYVVRTRYPTGDELRRTKPSTYPQREAVRWALHELGDKEG